MICSRLEPSIRRRIRVHFVNAAGLDEAGVDGGGLFREFLNDILKLAFHPNRGLFKLTSDGCLYPNPNIAVIESDFAPHYYFLGRILGKVRRSLDRSVRTIFSFLGHLRKISLGIAVRHIFLTENSLDLIRQSRYRSFIIVGS